jgi:ABC-type lipoprotein export system ATPase subunit
MQLSLDKLVPVPLKDTVLSGNSSVWNKQLSFNGEEYIFIQAPSGTGKTTLMHFLYGLRNDFEGTVNWHDKPIAKSNHLAGLRSKDISIIFQDMRLFPELTAWENLEIKRVLTNTVDEATVAGWMQRLGIEHKRDAPAARLSYGEQQRVAIIRALLQPFQWLLMDEPFSHLDNINIKKATALILEVVAVNKAGLLLADLEDNNYFPYTRKLIL